jgi:hypothetical protein
MPRPKPEVPIVQLALRVPAPIQERLRKYAAAKRLSINQAGADLLDRVLSIRGF